MDINMNMNITSETNWGQFEDGGDLHRLWWGLWLQGEVGVIEDVKFERSMFYDELSNQLSSSFTR